MEITNLWLQIIWIFVGGGFLALFPHTRVETVLGKKKERWTPLCAAILVLPYVLQAGFRLDIYGDTYQYRRSFLEMPTQLSLLPQYMEGVTKDEGFTVLSILIKTLIGNSDELYFLIIAAIQMFCMAAVYRKYSSNFWLSIFVFVASTDYMSWFHNGIRQFLALALIMSTLGLMLKKKYIPVIAVILLASTIHGSALLMLPIVFIVRGKAWNVKTILSILAAVLVLVYVEQFTDLLDTMLEDTQYSNMVTDWKEWEDDGTNPIRVLVYSIPMLLSLVGLRYIREADDPLVNMMVNFSILTFAIALVSMVTSGIFIGRLIVYGSVFSSSILLPWEIRHMFTKRSAQFITVVAVLAYLGFYYYQMHNTWGLI